MEVESAAAYAADTLTGKWKAFSLRLLSPSQTGWAPNIWRLLIDPPENWWLSHLYQRLSMLSFIVQIPEMEESDVG